MPLCFCNNINLAYTVELQVDRVQDADTGFQKSLRNHPAGKSVGSASHSQMRSTRSDNPQVHRVVSVRAASSYNSAIAGLTPEQEEESLLTVILNVGY